MRLWKVEQMGNFRVVPETVQEILMNVPDQLYI